MKTMKKMTLAFAVLAAMFVQAAAGPATNEVPKLGFGAVSDTHIMMSFRGKGPSGRLNDEGFEQALKCFRDAKVFRPGYAIEYDFFQPTQLFHTLETKAVRGLFLAGQVNGKTAEDMSRSFGKIFRKRQSETQSLDSDSVNTSYQLEDVLPISTIETLSRGTFFGKVADGNGETIDEKFFYGEIQRDERKLSKKRKQWTPIPQMTEFGDADIEQVMQENFERIQQDVREIIESEFAKTQDVEDEIQLEYEVGPFE